MFLHVVFYFLVELKYNRLNTLFNPSRSSLTSAITLSMVETSSLKDSEGSLWYSLIFSTSCDSLLIKYLSRSSSLNFAIFDPSSVGEGKTPSCFFRLFNCFETW